VIQLGGKSQLGWLGRNVRKYHLFTSTR